MRNRIFKIETNFLGKKKATKLGFEPTAFWATAKHATYCTTVAKSPTTLNSLSLNFFRFLFAQKIGLNFENSISHHC